MHRPRRRSRYFSSPMELVTWRARARPRGPRTETPCTPRIAPARAESARAGRSGRPSAGRDTNGGVVMLEGRSRRAAPSRARWRVKEEEVSVALGRSAAATATRIRASRARQCRRVRSATSVCEAVANGRCRADGPSAADSAGVVVEELPCAARAHSALTPATGRASASCRQEDGYCASSSRSLHRRPTEPTTKLRRLTAKAAVPATTAPRQA